MFSWRNHTSIKQKKGDGGNLKLINITILSLVIFFYITSYWIENRSIMDMAINSLPFLIMIILLVFLNSRIINSLIFLIIAIGTTIDPANISDYSGAIFFIYSFHLIKDKRYAGFLSLITISCLTIRSIIVNDTIPGTLIMIAVYGYIYAIYFFLIFKQEETPISKKLKQLTKEENELLIKMCSGKPQGIAGQEIGHNNKQQTSKLVSGIRKKLSVLDSESTDKVIYIFSKYGK